MSQHPFFNLLTRITEIDEFNRPYDNHRKEIPMHVCNEDSKLTIFFEISGVEKKDIHLDFYNNKLTIEVEKKKLHDTQLQTSEIKFGSFKRIVTLPICITKKETVSVDYKNGILKVTINKNIEEENKFSISIN